MTRALNNHLAHHSPANWFQFFVPALLMIAMFVQWLPAFVVAGIAVACMAANGYVITRKPVLLRQMAGMAWVVGGAAFSLFALEHVASEPNEALTMAIAAIAVAGVLIGFLSTLWHFATIHPVAPAE